MRRVSATGAALCLILAACEKAVTSNVEPSSILSITIPTSVIPSGTSVQASASITDPGGSSRAVGAAWSSSDPTIASVSSSGLITGALEGSTRIRAMSGATTGGIVVRVVAGAPASIVVFAGNNQFGPRGSQLPDPLSTNVLDGAGNLVVGAMVSYSVTTGGGHLDPPTTPVTDANGVAISGLWTLGSDPGSQSVTASSLGAESVTFTATAQ